MSDRVKDKSALISGAARGQGEAHARLLADEGAAVVIGDVLDDAGKTTALSIRDAGGTASFVHLDVTQPADWEAAISLAEREHGKLDALVNNAGITAYAGVADCTDEEWARVIAVNQTGVFHGMRAAIPALRRAGGGAIVNTASIFGLYGAEDYFAYVASKAAVIGMTKSAALTYGAEGIRVNAIAPGVIDTPMLQQEMSDLGSEGIESLLAGQPVARAGRPEDTAYAVLYLVSEESSFITGEVITIDGGYSAR